jgi:N-acetyl-anhydromuramyl-L-alanine amidase AmpD
MTTPLDGIGAALKKNGITVRQVKGWKTRGRPGTFAPQAVMFHHTASSRTGGTAPALNVVTHGRSDLPGPLCQVLVGRDGTVFLVAGGRANHAGEGGPFRNIPVNSGNSFSIGVEVENDGIGEPWSDELRKRLGVIFAVLLRHIGKDEAALFGHKEWAPGRKIDPGGIEMKNFRDRTGGALKDLK